LRQAPAAREAAYRILLDQIPPPAAPGTVRLALRLSIPVFAEPAARAAPQLQWSIESAGGRVFLVAVNSGTRHETVRGIALLAADGAALQVEAQTPPYVLAGAARRWLIPGLRSLPPGSTLRLTAGGDGGAIDQMVRVNAAR
jgi:fimbrial chaperone protein